MSVVGSSDKDLLVFGYSCKLFRDDARALSIDRGDHLIPWMGQQDMPIDRYDGRGALNDLASYESNSFSLDPLSCLTPEDRQIEQFCEDERYRSMTTEDVTIEAREEEEDKMKGARVGFDYDNPPQVQQAQQPPPQQEQPSLRALANCIEKTAEFICSQGAQMEILMRAKEAGNLKFQFLNPDNPYHNIYKQVLETKRSRPKGYVANAGVAKQVSLDVEKSLKMLTASLPSAAPNLGGSSSSSAPPSTASNNSSSAYSQLVERIRVNQLQEQQHNRKDDTPTPPATPAPVPDPSPTPEELEAERLAVLEREREQGIVTVIPPPIAMQPLIDKTASYVARNGTDMLAVVKKSDPEGFAFLREDNQYNLFFQYKVTLYKEMLSAPGVSSEGKAKNGSSHQPQTMPSQEEQMQQVTAKFPTLKGFFR